MTSFNQIPSKQLLRLIGLPTCPIIIDVTIDEDFLLYPYLIPSAKRCDHRKILDLLPCLIGQKVVIVCQKGLKLSMGAAALLRAHDIDAEILEGGNQAWRAAKHPVISYEILKKMDIAYATVERNSSLWVTKQRPKIDRIACPWLIRRFIDPDAKFLFVEESQVLNVAEKYHAISFDVKGADYCHRDDLCSFDDIMSSFQLYLEPLKLMANIIRGADTGRHDLAPQISGLMAISFGVSRMYKDDQVQLENSLLIYDAMYRYARDAQNERHDGTHHR